MSDDEFGWLEDVPINTAWKHEAHDFTPWLAGNLDRLGAAIKVNLELVDTEVQVGRFSADILAREEGSQRRVLIENQVVVSDHKHLGQIMTYLSGLDASIMVWVAPDFREEHLSAIRWLNDQTVDPFAFFAIRLRAVRIGNSPIAPLFEVVEQPNDWEREAHRDARMSDAERTELGKARAERWNAFSALHPDLAVPEDFAAASYWYPTDSASVVVAVFLGGNRVGVFVRGPRNEEDAARDVLLPHADDLSHALGVPFRGAGQYTLYSRRSIDHGDPDDPRDALQWLGDKTSNYVAVINSLID